MIADGRLSTWRYDGFWSCMDTFKEKVELEELWSRGTAPWQVWKRSDQSLRQVRPEERMVRLSGT